MKKVATAARQRGMSFANLLLGAILIVFLAIGGMKIIPAFVENKNIVHILDTVAHDPEMQEATPLEIKNSFYKRATINSITVVSADDLEIQKTPAGPILSVKYNVKIPLFGNASILLEFDSSSAHPR